MKNMAVKGKAVDCKSTPYGLSDSLVSVRVTDSSDIAAMIETWIDIEDDAGIMECEVGEALEEL